MTNQEPQPIAAVTETVSTTVDKLELALTTIITKTSSAIPNILLGLILLFLGLFFIKTLLKLIDKRFAARSLDPSLRGFLRSIISFVLYALLIITVISNVGIQTTSFIAVMSAVALGVGSALQGSLSNFAGGVLILVFRPYEIGDYIENSSGTEGTVQKIDLLYTTLVNSNGIMVFSPNGPLANSVIKNFSKITKRRFEFSTTVSFSDNLKDVKDIIEKALLKDERILQEPKPDVFVKEIGGSGVVLTIRVWSTKPDYTAVSTQVQEEVSNALLANGFTNPFLASPVHIIDDTPKE